MIDDNDFLLADSTAIIHYLERKRPNPALLPEGDRALGEALFLDAWAGGALFRDVVHPIFHNQIVNPNIREVATDDAVIERALGKAEEAFAYLEARAPEDFLVSASLTLADLAVVSNLITFHYLGRHIAPRFAKLSAYFKRHLDSPPIREALGEERPFVDQMGLDRSFAA